MKDKLQPEKISQFLKDLKTVAEHELRKRPWQSYALALGMVSLFFLTAQTVLGEDAPPTSESTAFKVEYKAEKPAPAERKISGFALSDSRPPESSWEQATEVEATVASSMEPTLNVGPPAPQTNLQADSTSNANPVESAADTAYNFYLALDRGDTESAYGKLSKDFRDSLPYHRFRDGYEYVNAVSSEVKYTEKLSEEAVRVDLEIEVSEQGEHHRYLVTCLVTKNFDEWHLSGIAQLEG